MENNNYQKPKVEFVKFTPLSLRMSYKDNDEKDDYAVLSWAMRNGYMRIIVYLKNANKVQGAPFNYNDMLTAAFTPVVFESVLTALEDVIGFENGEEVEIDTYNNVFENRQRTDKIEIQSTVVIGKSSTGVNFISIVKSGARTVKFPILPDMRYTRFKDKKGNVVADKAILSDMHTKSYVKLLDKLTTKASTDRVLAVEQQPKAQSTSSVDTSTLKEDELF